MSTDRHDPLDADERELARVLRALPAGEPPSALDARILAMARDAVVTTPLQRDEARPRRAPRFVWGLGVAASCVMAAGLVWRMGGFGSESLDLVGSELREEAAAGQAPEPGGQPAAPLPPAPEEHISVEIGASASAPRPAMAPPPPPSAEAPAQRARTTTNATPPPLAAAPPAPAPEPAAAPAPALLPEPEASISASSDAAEASPALERVTVYGSRMQDLAAEPSIAADGSAGAQAWIQRIRARIVRGDADGARASLEAFIARYPGKPLPQDLIDFGRSAGVASLPTESG